MLIALGAGLIGLHLYYKCKVIPPIEKEGARVRTITQEHDVIIDDLSVAVQALIDLKIKENQRKSRRNNLRPIADEFSTSSFSSSSSTTISNV